MCAFANDLPNHRLPGYLLIGVNDKGKLSGLKVTDELLKNLGALRSEGNILPPPVIQVKKISFPEGDVAVVEVQPSFFPPVRYKGKVWIRIGPRKAVANEAEERLLIERRQAGVASYDNCPFSGATLNDLRLDIFNISIFLKRLQRMCCEVTKEMWRINWRLYVYSTPKEIRRRWPACFYWERHRLIFCRVLIYNMYVLLVSIGLERL